MDTINASEVTDGGAVPNTEPLHSPRLRLGEPARTVVVLAFDRVTLSDVVGPIDVFFLAKDIFAEMGANEQQPYDVVVASLNGGSVRSSSGLQIATIALRDLDAAKIDTLIVTGGGPPATPPIPHDIVGWLAAEGHQIRRICAVCTGIFLVAEAGLAKGKRVTTHWMAASALAARYPNVIVDSDPVFVRDGTLWSAAGFTAGLDLTLALIEDDFGHEVAIRLARTLVMFIKRPGGQSQFSAPLATQSAGDASFEKLHAWIVEHLAEELQVERLADKVGMTTRTFARRYVAQIGRTPAKTIEVFRLESACRQIVRNTSSLKQVAKESGFGNEQNMRRTFLRHFGVIPQQYREHFGSYGSALQTAAE